MSPYEKISSVIDEHAEMISSELIEIRIYDIDRLKAQLKVRLKDAIKNSLQSFKVEGEDELNILLDKQAIVGTGDRNLNRKISVASGKVKEARRALHTIRDWDEYLSLKKFIREKFGDAVMDEFYKDIPMINKVRRERKTIS